MKTEWDYTTLANAYLKRPDYAISAIGSLLKKAGCGRGSAVCDIGAGVAHLTMMLADHGLRVTAVEPNDAMRTLGISRTSALPAVHWVESTAENTKQPDSAFDLVTFGSSFNVTDRPLALKETARILRSKGWFACMWNHRRLDDPIQQEIEAIIAAHIPGYDYGTRRQDQTDVINASGLFDKVEVIEGNVMHVQSVADCIEAWYSHGTLERQAGTQFPEIVASIATFLRGLKRSSIDIPYQTRIWAAQRIK